ncbi:MAG: hypothetical protein FJX15_06060 [Alphaproteobacteria bacterium]|nr:hypothetical protein [Alphaproteobacteria bacterium]
MMGLRRALACTSLLAAVALLSAPAHSAFECGSFDASKKLALMRIESKEPKVNFVSGPSKKAPNCPSSEPACRLKAFLTPGDEALIAASDAPFVCATYVSARGAETTGLLPREAIQPVAPDAIAGAKWDGEWRRTEAKIVLKSRGDVVKVSGSATYGAEDSERVKRGAVNLGELDGEAKPRGNTLAIGYDPDRSADLPTPEAAKDSCAARLSLYSRYLVVEDNLGCGGMNVSFSGVYVRGAK